MKTLKSRKSKKANQKRIYCFLELIIKIGNILVILEQLLNG